MKMIERIKVALKKRKLQKELAAMPPWMKKLYDRALDTPFEEEEVELPF